MLSSIDKAYFISQLKVIWENMIAFQKISPGQGDDYTTGCLLGYS